MSAIEKPIESLDKGIGRPPKEWTIEHLTDASEFVRILNRTQQLTDEAYMEIVNDIGFRAALLVLRAKALSGDVRALDLYLRICKDDKRERANAKAPTRQVTASFGQSPRLDEE